MQSKPNTANEYIKSLPEDRRKAMQAIRKVILDNLGKGFEEGIQYGMLGYYVPHKVYPAGYHCQPKTPLPFATLGSQKNHMAFYSFFLYLNPEELDWFVSAWKATGKKLDMGKSCIRFKKNEDVPLEVIGEAIKRQKVKDYVAFYDDLYGAGSAAKKKVVKKKATKKPAAKKKTVKKPVAKKAAAKKAASKKKATKKKVTKKTVTKKTAR